MLVLGIETSCDETAIAVVESGKTVLSSQVASQIEKHKPFGGVVPEIAAREHLRLLPSLCQRAFLEAQCKAKDIDAVAVTQGPGLMGALLVGTSFARGFASCKNLPLIPVDHVHAHVFGTILSLPKELALDELFPALALVVSGGHTNLYKMNSVTEFELLAYSLDDACGECFDKVARLLDLGYPGGQLIESLAKEGRRDKFSMPKMLVRKGNSFSYSGLKTHLRYLYEGLSEKNPQLLKDLCASFQAEALAQLERKITYALKKSKTQYRSVLLSGGVSANQALRQLLAKELALKSYFPELKYCGDNAAMIAAYGYFIYQNSQDETHFESSRVWDAYARYKFSDMQPKQ